MTLEQQQDELIRIWLEGEPEEVRKKVAALPPLDEGPSHEVGASDDAATWERAGAAEWADPATWCDSHIERLQDEFDLTLGQALGIAEWGRGMVRRALEGSEGHMLTRVLTRLLLEAGSDESVVHLDRGLVETVLPNRAHGTEVAKAGAATSLQRAATQTVLQAFDRCGHSVSRTSRTLGISRTTVYRHLREAGRVPQRAGHPAVQAD